MSGLNDLISVDEFNATVERWRGNLDRVVAFSESPLGGAITDFLVSEQTLEAVCMAMVSNDVARVLALMVIQ